jgi:uncharacterized membrane protein
MLLLLMPMSLFQAASLSADATTNGLAILFTALIWQMASTPALPRSRAAEACPMRSYQSWKKVTLLAGLIMLLALTKFAYLPLAALVLLIPSSCLGGRGRYVTVVALLFLAGLCALAAWVPQTHGLDTTIRVTPKVLASHQAAELAAHPSRLITVPIATFFRDALFLLKSFIGRLGSLDIPLSTIFIIPYALMLLAACWPSQNDSQAVDARRAMLVISMSVGACIAAIGLLNYIFWTPVGSRQIDGLQGRYLIPLAPAVIILLRTLLRKLPAAWWMNRHEWRLDATAAAMAFMGGAYTLIAVYLRYY